jgi:hypothetical protein
MGTQRQTCLRRRREDGAVAIIVALSMAGLVIVGGMVLDFGLVRLDRQTNKLAADSAAISGLEGMRHVDALGNQTGKAAPYAGVCSALEYLQANQPELASVSGTLTDGLGNHVAGAACPLPAASALKQVTCDPDDRSTWAWYSGTADGGRLQIDIRNGYVAADDASSFREEDLTTLVNDQGEMQHKGCDQLAVIISESRTPGLGSVATDDDLTSSVRSVARVNMGADPVNMALVVLEQKDCAAVYAKGGARIRVDGFEGMPGMIHVDSIGDPLGDKCSTNSVIDIEGSLHGAIVAGESEWAPKLPGVIQVHAPSNASRGVPYIYAEPYPPGAEAEVLVPRITRKYVDSDYFTGVRLATSAANDAWASGPAADVVITGPDCTASVPPLQSRVGTWYFDCDSVAYSGNVKLANATKVIFRGSVSVQSNREFAMPKAQEVYINRPDSPATPGLSIKGQFRMHTDGTVSNCKSMAAPAERARLVIGTGEIFARAGTSGPFSLDPSVQAGWSLFQACHTAVIMMGGDHGGCVPADTDPKEPRLTSCNGFLDLAGNSRADWTAPNLKGADRVKADQTDLEDLALWTESDDSSSIVGGGSITLAGVFVLPNANPFDIGGSGAQDVEDSQYFTRKLSARGGGYLYMKPNPHNVTKVPYFDGFALVR